MEPVASGIGVNLVAVDELFPRLELLLVAVPLPLVVVVPFVGRLVELLPLPPALPVGPGEAADVVGVGTVRFRPAVCCAKTDKLLDSKKIVRNTLRARGIMVDRNPKKLGEKTRGKEVFESHRKYEEDGLWTATRLGSRGSER